MDSITTAETTTAFRSNSSNEILLIALLDAYLNRKEDAFPPVR